MNRQCFWEMFGGIALPGRKLGCLVLEIYNRVSLFIISNSILIKCQRINGVKVRLDGRILRLLVGDDLFPVTALLESRASTRKS